MKCGSCGPRRCGGGCGADYSSRADQKPSLGAIDIVDGIFRQALRNMAKRLSMLRTGEMTPEELDAANEKLVFWLASTFSGENRHFETVDEWHPYGLSDELERIFGDHLRLKAVKAMTGPLHERLAFSFVRVKRCLPKHLKQGCLLRVPQRRNQP